MSYMNIFPLLGCGSWRVRREVNKKSCIPHIFISTFTKNSIWPWKQQHLIVLDCDNIANMIAACHWLKTEEPKIEYAIIESMPNRFWVVTDYLGTWKQVWNIFDHIPGVCNVFRSRAKDHGRICIRAFPKLIGEKTCTPTFPEETEFTPMSAARAWMLRTQMYFESKCFKRMSKALLIINKLSNGTIEQLAANPTFRV